MPRNTCGCKYHSNVILMLESLHRKYPDIVPLYSREVFLPLCVCDMENQSCMDNTCVLCSEGKLFDLNVIQKIDTADIDVIKYCQWQQDGDFLMKKQHEKCSKEVLQELSSQLAQFLWHVFIKLGKTRKSIRINKEKSTGNYQYRVLAANGLF